MFTCQLRFACGLVFVMGVSVPSASGAETAAPIALHAENPHYFTWRGKPTVLVTSGEHYGAVLNLDFDYAVYLKALAADGLNHTRVFSGTYREIPGSFGITDNPLAPKPGRFACPWARSETPGEFDGGKKFDLRRFDPAYFERLHDFLRQARDAGVVVEFNLFCPLYRDELWSASPMNAANNINGVGDCPRTEVFTLKHPDLLEIQFALVRKVAAELRDYDNLYYEVCNEPYFGGVTLEWQQRVVLALVKAEKDLPHQHLISMNIANGTRKVEKPQPGVSILNFHYCVPPIAVAENYGLGKVIGENETGFRGREDVLYRTEGWDFLIAGGGLYNNLDYSFTPQHPDGAFLDYKSPGGGSPELRKQLGVLKRFVEGFDFVRMKPDKGVIRKLEPKLTGAALVEPGKQYAIYLHVPIEKKPKDVASLSKRKTKATLSLELPAGKYRAEWIDTTSGEKRGEKNIAHGGGALALESPEFTADVALRIVAE